MCICSHLSTKKYSYRDKTRVTTLPVTLLDWVKRKITRGESNETLWTNYTCLRTLLWILLIFTYMFQNTHDQMQNKFKIFATYLWQISQLREKTKLWNKMSNRDKLSASNFKREDWKIISFTNLGSISIYAKVQLIISGDHMTSIAIWKDIKSLFWGFFYHHKLRGF